MFGRRPGDLKYRAPDSAIDKFPNPGALAEEWLRELGLKEEQVREALLEAGLGNDSKFTQAHRLANFFVYDTLSGWAEKKGGKSAKAAFDALVEEGDHARVISYLLSLHGGGRNNPIMLDTVSSMVWDRVTMNRQKVLATLQSID